MTFMPENRSYTTSKKHVTVIHGFCTMFSDIHNHKLLLIWKVKGCWGAEFLVFEVWKRIVVDRMPDCTHRISLQLTWNTVVGIWEVMKLPAKKTSYFQKQGDFSWNRETGRLPPKQGVSMSKREGWQLCMILWLMSLSEIDVCFIL